MESVGQVLKLEGDICLKPEGLFGLHDTDLDWRPYFQGVPSCRAVRAGDCRSITYCHVCSRKCSCVVLAVDASVH